MKYKMKISIELFDKDGIYAAPKESSGRTIDAESVEDAVKVKNMCWCEAICAAYNELALWGALDQNIGVYRIRMLTPKRQGRDR